MQRDFELVRKLLMFFEERQSTDHAEDPPIEGYSERAIKYHLILMYEAGLLSCEPIRSKTSERVIYVIPFDLTWDGHEFLSKIKSEGVWKRIRKEISSKGGSLAFTVVNQLATRFAVELIGHVSAGSR